MQSPRLFNPEMGTKVSYRALMLSATLKNTSSAFVLECFHLSSAFNALELCTQDNG